MCECLRYVGSAFYEGCDSFAKLQYRIDLILFNFIMHYSSSLSSFINSADDVSLHYFSCEIINYLTDKLTYLLTVHGQYVIFSQSWCKILSGPIVTFGLVCLQITPVLFLTVCH